MLWQTDRTLHLCGLLKRMFILLACEVVKYGVLDSCREFSSSLSRSILHFHLLKGTLDVKQTTTNWAVL
jgi:hypothetical protein